MSMKYIFLSAVFFVFALSSCAPDLTTEDHLKRGQSFMESKDWRSAVIEFKNGIKKSPKNANVRYLLGKAYLQTFSSDAAIKEFKKSIELGMDANKVIVSLGKAYALRNKNDEIITEIVVNENLSQGDHAEILAIRAEAFIRKEQPQSALKELQKAKTIDENSIAVRLAWATYESTYGSVENQLKWLSPLYELNVANAWSQKGKIEGVKLNLEEAEKAYSKAIQIRKVVHKDYLSRALIRVSLEKFEDAKSDLRLLKKAGFVVPLIFHTEGVIAYRLEDYELAQSKAKEVLGKFKEFPPSLYLLGLSQFKQEKFVQAINSLLPYLKTNPDNSEARLVLSVSLINTKKFSKAIEELEYMRKQDPNNEKISSLLSRAYILNGDIDRGLSYIRESIKLDPTNAKAQLYLGSVLLEDKKDVEKGRKALSKAIDLDPNLFQANLNLYISYMKTKSFGKASDIANIMINKKPEESLAYNLLGHSYLAGGDVEKALDTYESTLTKFPADPLTSASIANYKIKNNKLDEAKSIYLNVLKKHPTDLMTLQRLAVVESRLGNHKAKIEYLEKAVKSEPNETSPKIILANAYLMQKDYKKALNALRDINEFDKSKIEVLVTTAQAKMGLKDYDYSLLLWKKIIAQNPNSASAHYFLGQNYGRLKKEKQMKLELEKALSIQPDHFSAALILTRLALFEGNLEEFKERMGSMNKLYPENVDVKFLNAKLQNKEEKYDSAIATLETLLLDVPNTEVAIDIARNKWAFGDLEGAIIGLELWSDANPNDIRTLMLLGQLYVAKNRFSDADSAYSKVDKLVPNNATVLNNRAWLYLENNNIEEGEKLAKKALSLKPNSPFIKDTLSMLLLKNKKLEEALIYSSQAAKAQPDFVEIQINYAKILIANNDKSLARKVLNRANTKVKSFEQRKQVNDLLIGL